MNEQITFRAGAWYKSVTGMAHVGKNHLPAFRHCWIGSTCGVQLRASAGPFALADLDPIRDCCPRCLTRALRERKSG